MFTEDEINVLLEAVEAWEKEDAASGLMSMMLGAMLIKDEAERDAMMEESKAATEAKTNAKKERAILLKAKLIQMRNANIAREAAAFLQNPTA